MSQSIGIVMTAIAVAPFALLWFIEQDRWNEHKSHQEALDKLWKEMYELREALRPVGNIPEMLDNFIDITQHLRAAGNQKSAGSRKEALEGCKQQVEEFGQRVMALRPIVEVTPED